jgi:peptidoglycan/LPS O-acetylase OafA/YrhL
MKEVKEVKEIQETVELSPKSEISQNIEIVDFLRGAAALAVMWFHFTTMPGFLEEGLLKRSGEYGWLGVETFFVISGFIIPYSMWRSHFKLKEHWLIFFKKRIARLYPAYLVAIALSVLLPYVASLIANFKGVSYETLPVNLILHFFYLNSFFKEYPLFNPAFWTLAIEVQYYVVIVFFYSSISARQVSTRFASCILLGIVSLLLVDKIAFFNWGSLFCMGILAFQRYALNIKLTEYFTGLGLVFATAWIYHGWLYAIVGALTALIITFVKIPRIGLATYFANISYSLYLLHTPVGTRILSSSRLGGTISVKILAMVLACVLTIFTATIMYKWVEKPGQRWVRKILLPAPVKC